MTTATGALASGTWQVQVIDEVSGASACTVSGLHATCTIPPRVAGTPPRAYRVIASVDNVTNLWPATVGPFAEYAVLGRTYTGLAPVTVQHCDARVSNVVGTTIMYSCAYTTYAHVTALDHAVLSFDAFALSYRASPDAGVALAPLPYAPGAQTTAALSWDSGVELLPGQ